MRGKLAVFAVLALVYLVLTGCAPKVVPVVPSGPAISYPEKIDAVVAVCFDPDLVSYIDRFSLTEDFCAGHSYDIMLGNGMVDAVKKALETVFTKVVEVDTTPSPDQMVHYDAFISVTLEDVESDAEVTQLTFGHKMKVRYDISMTLNLYGKNLKLVYPYNASARGIKSTRVTSCSEVGDIIAEGAKNALDKLSTNIAQALYSAAQVQDYFKNNNK